MEGDLSQSDTVESAGVPAAETATPVADLPAAETTAPPAAELSASDIGALADAISELDRELGLRATLDDRLIRLPDPVPGAPHLAVLQALGQAARAGVTGAVAAAAHGPNGVAAALWQRPQLYVVRWTGPSRLVTHYKFPTRGRPDDYLREDGGIPSHLTKDNWYREVPNEVSELLFGVGLLLDEAPFPVPQPPPPPPTPPAPAPRARAASAPRRAAAPRAPRPKAAPAAPKKVAPTTRACSGCNLQKHPSQFEPGSDLCVDCR